MAGLHGPGHGGIRSARRPASTPARQLLQNGGLDSQHADLRLPLLTQGPPSVRDFSQDHHRQPINTAASTPSAPGATRWRRLAWTKSPASCATPAPDAVGLKAVLDWWQWSDEEVLDTCIAKHRGCV